MPEKKSKKSGKTVELPKGVRPLKKNMDTAMFKDINEKMIPFVDELMDSPWQPHRSRPRNDMVGYYVICRWYPRYKGWAVLYAGRGNVRSCLNHSFKGGQKNNALGNYLSSFNKECRNKLWFKWTKDPFYPYEGLDLDQFIEVVQHRYNCGEMPAFNADFSQELVKEEKLPADFSIIPNWEKPKRRKPADATA